MTLSQEAATTRVASIDSQGSAPAGGSTDPKEKMLSALRLSKKRAQERVPRGSALEAAHLTSNPNVVLATAAIQSVLSVQGESDPSYTVHAYLRMKDAERRRANLDKDKTVQDDNRIRILGSLYTQERTNAAGAAGFSALLAAVQSFEPEFDATYVKNGKIDRDAVGALYDATDPTEHPAFSALPSTTTQSREREVLIGANHLVRFIVATALDILPEQPA